MSSNKIGRINDDIQRVLSKLLTEVKDPRVQQGMISVTRVETTGDLRYCKVWLAGSMHLRYTPELVFEIDHSIEYGAHISQMISELDIKHDEDEDNEL